MPNLLIHLAPKQGYNNVFELGQYDMKLTRFGIVQLKQGTAWSYDTGDFEAALVLLGGKCAVKGKGFEFAEVGGRRNVFDGKPHTVYLPRRTACTVTALTDMDFALNESPATRDTAPIVSHIFIRCTTLRSAADRSRCSPCGSLSWSCRAWRARFPAAGSAWV